MSNPFVNVVRNIKETLDGVRGYFFPGSKGHYWPPDTQATDTFKSNDPIEDTDTSFSEGADTSSCEESDASSGKDTNNSFGEDTDTDISSDEDNDTSSESDASSDSEDSE